MSSDMPIEEIIKLPGMEDVLAELNDPRYSGRSHGSRATYTLKCDGPLCKLAERLRGRRRNQERAERRGMIYSPNPHKYDREELLLAVTAWHKMDLYKRKMDAAS